MYDTILYPTDGSDGAEAALEPARDLAMASDGTVHVLHVAKEPEIHGLASDTVPQTAGGMIGDPEGDSPGMVGDRTRDPEVQTRAEERGAELVQSVAERFRGVETRTAVEWGDPYQSILDYVDDHDVDVIVMATHGRTGLDRYLLGSVTEKVVRTADVPVLTVRGDGG